MGRGLYDVGVRVISALVCPFPTSCLVYQGLFLLHSATGGEVVAMGFQTLGVGCSATFCMTSCLFPLFSLVHSVNVGTRIVATFCVDFEQHYLSYPEGSLCLFLNILSTL